MSGVWTAHPGSATNDQTIASLTTENENVSDAKPRYYRLAAIPPMHSVILYVSIRTLPGSRASTPWIKGSINSHAHRHEH
mgnify:CR=1